MWRARQHRFEPSGKVIFMHNIVLRKNRHTPVNFHFHMCWLWFHLLMSCVHSRVQFASTGMPKMLGTTP